MQHSSSIATATGTQIWPYNKKVKCRPSFIILTNLEDPESPVPYTKIQPQSFLSTGKDFEVFLRYMGMAAILFSGAEPFEQIINILLTEGPRWNLVKIGQAVSEKKRLRFHDLIHVSSPRARADNPGWGKILILTKKFYYFNHTL